MNTGKFIAKFKKFQIILESGCSSTIVMGRIVGKLNTEKYSVMQWHTQTRNIATNIDIKVYFILPALSAKNVVAWICHVDYSSKGRYDMILRQDILT